MLYLSIHSLHKQAKRGDLDRQIERIFILYRDRLTRFGFRYIKQICDFHHVEIVVVSEEETTKTQSEELAEDIIALIHSFSGKLYGLRKRIKEGIDSSRPCKWYDGRILPSAVT